MARRLREFSADELRRLASAWRELPPAPRWEVVMQAERDRSFLPLWRETIQPGFRDLLAVDEGGVETEASAGLKALLAGAVAGGEGSASPENLLRWKRQVLAHPGGHEAYLRELPAAYDAEVARLLRLALQPTTTGRVAAPEDLLLHALDRRGNNGRIARTFYRFATQARMLEAAIQLRLKELGEAAGPPVPDPWRKDGGAFAVETLPDGGFVLRSTYEVSPGKPLAYAFATPDAGHHRPE